MMVRFMATNGGKASMSLKRIRRGQMVGISPTTKKSRNQHGTGGTETKPSMSLKRIRRGQVVGISPMTKKPRNQHGTGGMETKPSMSLKRIRRGQVVGISPMTKNREINMGRVVWRRSQA